MKRVLIITALISLMSFIGVQNTYRYIPNNSFKQGEKLTYRVHYGFINAGEAEMIISDKIHQINKRPCYKIEVKGKSTGMFDYILRIRDTWGTYLDTSALVPQRFYRNIEEGKYRRNEIAYFDHFKDSVRVDIYDKQNVRVKKSTQYSVPNNVQDMVSGYYFLRTLDFDKMTIGQITTVKGFLEDTSYDLQIRYLGKQEVSTDLGKMSALVIAPVMPENSLFKGEDAIKVWISNDKNKIPLKVQAGMFVGAVELDITSYTINGRTVSKR